MGAILRQLRSLPGMIIGMTISLIIIFFVWNFLASKGVPFASWIEGHANGTAYGQSAPVVTGVPATPGPGF